MGIDFTGGTMIQVNMGKEVPVQELQDVLASQELSGDIVHAGEANDEVIIKTTQSLDTEKRETLINALVEKYGITEDSVLSIVIFDRIRETLNFMRSKTVSENTVNQSIAQTIGRSIMTSFTTVCVMIPLLIICGSTIRSFILPLMVGVIASTLSSIFIATSVWYDINKSTEVKKSKYHGAVKAAKS